MIRILVPVDFTKVSFSAYNYAVHFAESIKAEITVLHVINGSFSTADSMFLDTMDAADSRCPGTAERPEHGAGESAQHGSHAFWNDRGGGPELHSGPEHRQPVYGDRRGSEPHTAGGEDDHHPGGAWNQNRVYGRSIPD